MTFYREGKKMDYLEIIHMLEALINEGIIGLLEVSELSSLFIKIFESSNEMINAYFSALGYRIVNIEQCFKVIEKEEKAEIWKRAIGFYNEALEGKVKKDELVEFVEQKFIGAMKELYLMSDKKNYLHMVNAN